MYKQNNNFEYDLKFGQMKEKELADILENQKIEVKTDCKWKKTGNVAVEYKSRGKNLLDNNSKVVRAKGNVLDSVKIIQGPDYNEVQGSKRNYDLLQYINTRPRTSYLPCEESESCNARCKIPRPGNDQHSLI